MWYLRRQAGGRKAGRHGSGEVQQLASHLNNNATASAVEALGMQAVACKPGCICRANLDASMPRPCCATPNHSWTAGAAHSYSGQPSPSKPLQMGHHGLAQCARSTEQTHKRRAAQAHTKWKGASPVCPQSLHSTACRRLTYSGGSRSAGRRARTGTGVWCVTVHVASEHKHSGMVLTGSHHAADLN